MKEIPISNSPPLIPELADDMTSPGLLKRLSINDACIRASALLRYIELEQQIPHKAIPIAVSTAKESPALRRQLLRMSVLRGRETLSEQLIEHAVDWQKSFGGSTVRYEKAIYQGNTGEAIEALHRLYLDTDDKHYLYEALDSAQEHYGWEKVLPIFLRLLFIEEPSHAVLVLRTLRTLDRDGAKTEFQRFGSLCQSLSGCGAPKLYWSARSALYNSEPSATIKRLEQQKTLSLGSSVEAILENCFALALERKGDFRKAAKKFQRQNKALSDKKYTYKDYFDQIERMASIPKPTLDRDPNGDFFCMTGFPRSGTTLLENALAAHPSISTAEETSALSLHYKTAFNRYKGPEGSESSAALEACFYEHRRLYYYQLERHIDSEAKVKIDKTPILSSYIQYLEKIFPEKKYIFSVRHPYDVALSNFKQLYSQNASMAAFNDIRETCHLYDYVMTNWFEIFPGTTDRVRYVYYDELVTDFEPTIRRVIGFLGVEWDDAVLDFAEHSKKRAVRTPSYANVRKGLSLGVQSSYQNYLFLFDEYCRSKLDPWVEFFGYKVEVPMK